MFNCIWREHGVFTILIRVLFSSRSSLSTLSILFGAILTLLGPVFYEKGKHVPHGHGHFTALIPSIIGLGILVAGIIARNPAKRKHAAHAGLGLALFGMLGGLMTVPYWPRIFTHDWAGVVKPPPLAVKEQFVMFVICAVYLALGVKSFIAARKAGAITASAS